MKRAFIGLSARPTHVLLGRVSSAFGRFLCVAACLVGAANLVFVLLAWINTLERLATIEPQVAAARTAMAHDAALTLPKPPKLGTRQVDHLNEVVQQLNLPWADLLDALEQRTPPDVGLTLIEPDSKKSSVRIQAEAKGVETLMAYAGALSAQAPFSGVNLLRHETNEQDEGRPVRLTFDVDLQARMTEPVVATGVAR